MNARLAKRSSLLLAAALAVGCSPGKTVADGPSADATGRESAPKKQVADAIDGVPERPGAHNTGPTNEKALVKSPSVTVKKDGTVLENLDITGRVKIKARDVTIRNFRIDASGTSYGILIEDGHGGIVLEDGEIFNMKSSAILAYSDFTARRLHIHDSGADGLKVQGGNALTIIERCFIEKLGRNPTSHADGNQTRGGSNIVFRYNNIYMPSPGTPGYPGEPYKSNATFMLEKEISNFVIEHNWLTGGNYTIYCPRRGGVVVRNNVFGRDNAGLLIGKADQRIRAGNCDEWSGNRWEHDGKPL